MERRLIVHTVATPVLNWLGMRSVRGRVEGSGSGAAYINADGFVIALTTSAVPLMPNGIEISGGQGAIAAMSAGAPVSLRSGCIRTGAMVIAWDSHSPPCWDPAVVAPTAVAADRIAARGEAVLRSCGLDPVLGGKRSPLSGSSLFLAGDRAGCRGIGALFGAIARRDVALAGEAAQILLGRGPGLTPEGDDLLAGAAAGVAVIAPAFGWDCETRKSWLGAVQSDGMRERTTALSATLLELASRGQVMEPVGSLLEFVQGHGRWKVAGQKLLGMGHSTGRAYAAALGATMVLLPGDHGRCSL